MSPEEAFALVMRRHRAELRLSQEKLAELAGVSRPFASKLERGVTQPSLNTVLKISAAFGLTAKDLVGEVEEAMRRPLPKHARPVTARK